MFVLFGLKLILLILAGDHTATLRFGECFESERNAGLVHQYTDDCITFMYQEEIRSIFAKLQFVTVPYEFSGKASTTLFWSAIRYSVKDFTLVGYEQPKVTVSMTEANGIVVNNSLPVLKFRGKYTLDLYNGPWIEYSRKGTISVTVFGTTLELHREMTLNEGKDRIKVTSTNCSASVKDIDVDLQDPISNAVIAGMKWDDEIRLYQEQFCTKIQQITTGEVDLVLNFSNEIYMDLTLLRQPAIYDGYLEFHFIAEVRYRGDENRYTRLPQPFVIKRPSKPDVFRISEFVFNSFGYVVHNHELMSFTYTRLDLPGNRKHLLDTTCDFECFGKLFPNASARWPDSSVEISVTSAEPPYVQITPDSFKVIFGFNIDAYARLTNDSAPLVFCIHLNMSVLVVPSTKNNRIRFEVRNQDRNITIIESRIGDLSEDHLMVVVSQAFQNVVVIFMGILNSDELRFSNNPSLNEIEFNFMNGDLSISINAMNVKERKPYVDLTLNQRSLRRLLSLLLFTVLP